MAEDASATWTSSCNCVTGSSVTGLSPRIVPVAVFDPLQLWNQGNCGGNCMVRVVNMFGFFIQGMCSDAGKTFTLDSGVQCTSSPQKDLVGRMMKMPGETLGTAGNVPAPADFIKIVQLVR